jgi:hypothetical protein
VGDPVAKRDDGEPKLQPEVVLAARQHNRVARRQLLELDFGSGAIAYRLRVGRLTRVDTGVYAVGPPGRSRSSRLMTAVLVSGEDAVLSYRAGAEHLGVRIRRGRRIDVTIPSKQRSRRDIQRHYALLRPDEITVHDGIPVTTLQRTVFDLASVLDRDELQSVLEQTARRLMDFDPVRAMMERQPRRKGVALLRELAPRVRPQEVRSWLEVDMVPFLVSIGAPPPLINAYVRTSKGLEQVDFYWPELKLVIECDGYEFHGGPSNLTADHLKDRRLRAARLRVERVSYDELHHDPDGLAAFLKPLFVRLAD